ncbi:MAG: sensor histidine kinase [Nitrospirota bacterium]
MLRLFRNLHDREVITPAAFILAFLFILSLIIILGQFFHQTLQNEMADQFNKQQLLLAREVAINIESFIDHVYEDISVISQLPEVDRIHRSSRTRTMAETMNFHIQSEMLVTIRVLDRQGRVIYDSAYPGREGADLSKIDYFIKTKALRRHEKFVTELMESPDQRPESKQFIIATPIYQQRQNSRNFEFNGVVLAVLSIEGITQKYLAPIKSGTRGYAWMMDSNGTLLYHPNQPQMVGKNLYHTDQSCFTCHRSFDTEKKMIEGKSETFGQYEAPGGENKLAAFYKIPIGSKSWLVVVSAPYSDVIALMRKSRFLYSSLIISIFIVTLAAAGILIIFNRQKIMAEEKAAHLENQRKLEQEIIIAKNYLENIIENTKTNLMVLDHDLNVKIANTAQAATLGRPKEDIIGRPFFSLFPDNLRPYDGIPIEALLHKTITGGKSFDIKEYRITGTQPEPIYLDMIVSPLLIAGQVTGIVITSNNVTKRVLLEEALKEYTTQLEVKIDREVATAKKLEQQVLHSEKLAALGRLAAGVAHEIGNPLTSISTFAQLLREMASDEFTQSSLDIINNHIRRITEIVRQMSTFARPDPTNIKPVQVNDILTSSLDLMRLDKRMKSTIDISVNLDPAMPKTVLDEGQIAQVFINIILNALDAMPDGGTFSVTSRHGANDQGQNTIFIEFRDSGTGILPADIERIFDPFYTTKEAGKGTGLGLSVSYNIVKRFKGDIKVTSEPGKGTAFTIILPVLTELQKEPTNA